MIPKTDPQIVKELAREAEGLLANRAFTEAVKVLRQQLFAELLDDSIDDPKVRRLRARLQALRDIPQMLDSIMAAPQFAQQGINVRRTTG